MHTSLTSTHTPNIYFTAWSYTLTLYQLLTKSGLKKIKNDFSLKICRASKLNK